MTPNHYVDLFRQSATFLKAPEGARPIIIASGGNDDDTLAADLKIHPNTAHKVVQRLIQERWLEMHPGIGRVVAEPAKARAGDRQRLLQQEIEQLVVEAKRVQSGQRMGTIAAVDVELPAHASAVFRLH